jgi:hypothetical protein
MTRPIVPRIAIGVLACVLSLLSAAQFPVLAADTSTDESMTEIIVRLGQASDLAAVTTQYGLEPVPLDQFTPGNLYRLRVIGPRTAADVHTAMGNDPRIACAEPNNRLAAPESGEFTPWASGEPSRT